MLKRVRPCGRGPSGVCLLWSGDTAPSGDVQMVVPFARQKMLKRVRPCGLRSQRRVCVVVRWLSPSRHDYLSTKNMRGAAQFIKFNDYSDASAGPSFIQIETFPPFPPFAVSLTLIFHSTYRNIYLR